MGSLLARLVDTLVSSGLVGSGLARSGLLKGSED
jgi:hypothetical protein